MRRTLVTLLTSVALAASAVGAQTASAADACSELDSAYVYHATTGGTGSAEYLDTLISLKEENGCYDLSYPPPSVGHGPTTSGFNNDEVEGIMQGEGSYFDGTAQRFDLVDN